jgi:hypothetical protein
VQRQETALGVEFSTAKAAKRLRGYLIRLTREYTDGGMDSRAEEEKGITKWIMLLLLSRVSNSFSAQMFAPPSVYSWVRRANGTRAGSPGPYICALLCGFCEKVFHS